MSAEEHSRPADRIFEQPEEGVRPIVQLAIGLGLALAAAIAIAIILF